MISPRMVKGGIVEIDPTSGRLHRVIALQYNPDSITRMIAVQAAGASGDPSQALRLKGVAVETLRLEAEIDATDKLASPAQNPDTRTLGIHPQLAALEVLVHPKSATLRANDALSKYQSHTCAFLHSLPPLGPSHHLLAPTGFCHMYNLADSMVELKHNAQTSKQQWFSFVLESSVS